MLPENKDRESNYLGVHMRKICIYLLTIFFVAVAVFSSWLASRWDGTVEISARISAAGNTEQIRCHNGGEDRVYLFLPAYAQAEQTQLFTNTRNAVYLQGKEIAEGMTCEEIPFNTDLDLAYEADGELRHFVLQILQSQNIPAMYIDTVSGSLEHIHEEKGNQESGTMRLYTQKGQLDYDGAVEELKGRGNDSWGKEKKPYSLNLRREENLLDMGAARKWILLANYSDPTHIRNKIVLDAAQALHMPYTPECQWVDLYLNGDYAGVYLLSERNEIHPQRVDIPEESSFLVSMEPVGRLRNSTYPYITTDSQIAFRLRETGMTQEAASEILRSADRAIHAHDGLDPVTGKHWRELLDLDSWARKYLIEEVFANLDANAASQFFYYTGDGEQGTLYAGPVWDYDLSMGSQTVWQTQASDALFAGSAHIWSEEDHPWFAALCRHPEFQERVKELYRLEFQPMLKQLLASGIDAYGETVAAAAKMNQLRWNSSDFSEQLRILRKYTEDRMAFLDSYWLEQEPYHIVTIDIRTGANIATYAIRSGETLIQFPESWVTWQGDNYGWHDAQTEERIDISQPIYEDRNLYLKWYPQEEAQETEMEPLPEEEPLSILRLGPAIVFSGMLVAVCSVGLWRSGEKRKKNPAHV